MGPLYGLQKTLTRRLAEEGPQRAIERVSAMTMCKTLVNGRRVSALLGRKDLPEVEPRGGRRHVSITERSIAVDWAHFIKAMLDERYPDAEKVVSVMYKLNS